MSRDTDKMSHEKLRKQLDAWYSQTFPGFLSDTWPGTWQYKMQAMELYERCRNYDVVAEILDDDAEGIRKLFPSDADWVDDLNTLRSKWTAQIAHEARLELLRAARNERGDTGHPERYMKAAVDASRCDWNMRETDKTDEAKERQQLTDPEYVESQRAAWRVEQGVDNGEEEKIG